MGQLPLFITTQQLAPIEDQDRGYFPTPLNICRYAIKKLVPDLGTETPVIIDPMSGHNGVWGIAARERWPNCVLHGADLPGVVKPDVYDFWHAGDYIELAPELARAGLRFDLALGNPRFALAEQNIRSTMPMIKPGGYMVQFLRIAFFCTLGRMELWRDLPLFDFAACSRRPSFTGDGVTDKGQEYALYLWKSGYMGQFFKFFDYEDKTTWEGTS
jgi:hypothetical protein